MDDFASKRENRPLRKRKKKITLHKKNGNGHGARKKGESSNLLYEQNLQARRGQIKLLRKERTARKEKAGKMEGVVILSVGKNQEDT